MLCEYENTAQIFFISIHSLGNAEQKLLLFRFELDTGSVGTEIYRSPRLYLATNLNKVNILKKTHVLNKHVKHQKYISKYTEPYVH